MTIVEQVTLHHEDFCPRCKYLICRCPEVLDERVRRTRDELARLLRIRAEEDAKRGVYRCTTCRENEVSPGEGEDTCASCVARQ